MQFCFYCARWVAFIVSFLCVVRVDSLAKGLPGAVLVGVS
ncbi:hypothetical protein FB466_0357 [Klugiella xanthotipulae]|uniref:Uncharacterized protein n=1 Tax=Klugiella xanthotipulae TaxID=244735 RepID=A0A543I4M8_9MICO|nr:hypothetical protein FB466_0357 [Klugiella xanthotipulae]